MITAAIALGYTRDTWLPLARRDPLDPLGRNLMRLALTMGGMQVLALVSYRIELAFLGTAKGVSFPSGSTRSRSRPRSRSGLWPRRWRRP